MGSVKHWQFEQAEQEAQDAAERNSQYCEHCQERTPHSYVVCTEQAFLECVQCGGVSEYEA